MTYKLELFLVLKKKKKRLINIKSKIMFFMVYLYWIPFFSFFFFYIKLTHLVQN